LRKGRQISVLEFDEGGKVGGEGSVDVRAIYPDVIA